MAGDEGEGGGGGKIDRQKKSAIRECTGKNAPPPHDTERKFLPPPPPRFKTMYLCYCFAISTVIICVM